MTTIPQALRRALPRRFGRSCAVVANRRAFTLVELLAVMAIVGILAAIIIPTVGVVRRNAQGAACVANLREIGVAFQLYAQSSGGHLPRPLDSDPGAAWPFNTWMYQLQPYVEQRKSGGQADNIALCYDGIFRCPGKPEWSLQGPTDANRISYGMSTFNANEGEVAARNTARNLRQFTRPSVTMLAMDRATFREDGSNAGMSIYIHASDRIYQNAVGLWHNKKDNVLFLDGHVEALPKSALNYHLVKSGSNNVTPLN